MKMASSGKLLFPRARGRGENGGQIIFIMRKLEKFGMQSFAAIGFKFLLPAVEFSFKHFPAAPALKRFSYWFPIHNIYVPIIASLTKPSTIASSTGTATATATGTAIVFPLFHFPLLLLALFLLLLPFLLLLLLLLLPRQWRNLLYKHSRAPNTFYPLLSRHLPCARLSLSFFTPPPSATLLCRHCKRITWRMIECTSVCAFSLKNVRFQSLKAKGTHRQIESAMAEWCPRRQ